MNAETGELVAGAVTPNGKVACIICIIACFIIAFTNKREQAKQSETARFRWIIHKKYDMLGRQVKNMKEVDARGLSCPEPIMLTAEALKNEKGPIKVLVSEPVQKENVEKYAKSQGKKPTSKEVGDEFEIVIE